LCALRLRLRAGSFGSPSGLAQDFASWRKPARRLNFGREEWVFVIRFPRDESLGLLLPSCRAGLGIW